MNGWYTILSSKTYVPSPSHGGYVVVSDGPDALGLAAAHELAAADVMASALTLSLILCHAELGQYTVLELFSPFQLLLPIVPNEEVMFVAGVIAIQAPS